MFATSRRMFSAFAALFFVFMTSSALLGILNNLDPVPVSDMWGQSLLFLARLQDEPWTAVFEQHVDHRIVWTRLLTLMDSAWFGGQFVSLFLLNWIFPLIGLLAVWHALRSARVPHVLAIALLLGGFAFSLAQQENFYWAFQSQMFLTAYLPLVGHVMLFSGVALGRNGLVIFGTLVAASATFAMANGAFNLIAAAFFLAAMRANGRVALAVSIAAAITFGGYMLTYSAQPNALISPQGNALPDLRQLPLFLLLFSGNLGHAALSPVLGLLFVIGAIAAGLREVFWKRRVTVSTGLASYAAFFLMVAITTAVLRLKYGIGGALSDRYTTPVFAAWICLLAYFYIEDLRFLGRKVVTLLTILLCLGAIPIQLKNFAPDQEKLAASQVTLLGMAAGMPDAERLRALDPYGPPGYVELTYEAALDRNLPWAENNDLVALAGLLNRRAPASAVSRVCELSADRVEILPAGVRLTGQISGAGPTGHIRIVEEGRIVGVGIVHVGLGSAADREAAPFEAFMPGRDPRDGLIGQSGYLAITSESGPFGGSPDPCIADLKAIAIR